MWRLNSKLGTGPWLAVLIDSYFLVVLIHNIVPQTWLDTIMPMWRPCERWSEDSGICEEVFERKIGYRSNLTQIWVFSLWHMTISITGMILTLMPLLRLHQMHLHLEEIQWESHFFWCRSFSGILVLIDHTVPQTISKWQTTSSISPDNRLSNLDYCGTIQPQVIFV